MKIVFFSHYFYPHIGGVEKHVHMLSKELIKKGHHVYIITEKFDPYLKDAETIDKIKVIRFSYPKQKILGLLFIWFFIWKKRYLLTKSDIIHIHDVFIWYFPYKFIFSNIRVITTIHGLEWSNPFSKMGLFQKKLAVKLSNKSIGVGKFLEKYINIKFDLIIYGAAKIINKKYKKTKNSIVFVGRLSNDTGINKFLDWLKGKKYYVDFIGDGEYKSECKKYGVVHGYKNPQRYLQKAEYAIPGGYLACIESFTYKCKVKVFFSNKLKKDYWELSPMYNFIVKEDINKAYNWASSNNWTKLANEMLSMYNSLQ